MQTMNPYDFIRPARREMFIGRKEELDKIINGIRQGNSYAVFGGRRIGKTSLLLEIDNKLKEHIKEEDFKVIPVYMDLHFPTIDTRKDFFTSGIDRLVDVMTEQFSEVKIEDKRLEELKNGPKGEENFEAALNYIIRTAEQSYINITRIALLVDEAEVILAKDWVIELYENLRSLLSNRPISQNLALVITGAIDFYKSIEEKVGSPLVNILYGVHLKGLTDVETEELIKKSQREQVDKDIVSEIYNQTGGHPYLIQYIMRHLYPEAVWSVDSVREIIKKYLKDRERTDFEHWYSKFDKPTQKTYSLLIEIGEQGINISQMDELISEDGLTIQKALDCLCFHGIVRRNPDGTYAIAGKMFKTWFIENVPSHQEMLKDIQDKAVPIVTGEIVTPTMVLSQTRFKHLERAVNNFLTESPFEQNVFIMMRFRDTNTFHGIEKKIKEALAEKGLKGYLASDKQYMQGVWENILVYMTACKYGVAVFEIIKEQDFNPNISLELGFMDAWGRKCLLLKDQNLQSLPTDIRGMLYKVFNPDRLASITDAVCAWVRDNVEQLPQEGDK